LAPTICEGDGKLLPDFEMGARNVQQLWREKRFCNFWFGWFLVLPSVSWLISYPHQGRLDMVVEGLMVLWGVMVLGWAIIPHKQV